jgi:hypothetical protein
VYGRLHGLNCKEQIQAMRSGAVFCGREFTQIKTKSNEKARLFEKQAGFLRDPVLAVCNLPFQTEGLWI